MLPSLGGLFETGHTAPVSKGPSEGAAFSFCQPASCLRGRQAASLLIVALLLRIPLQPQIACQFVHARRSGSVACVFRIAYGLIYLPVKGANLVQCVLKYDDETGAIPKFHVVTVNKPFGILDGLCVIVADYLFAAGKVTVSADQKSAILRHGAAPKPQGHQGHEQTRPDHDHHAGRK
jgi:hypothetical protein